MDTSLVNGLAAEQLLTNENFIAQWQQLYNQVKIAYPFQAPAYVNAWWQTYHHNYDLAFALGYTKDKLIACLPLCIRGNQITAVGCHQAEYQAWLATPEKQYDFLSALVTDIQQAFPNSRLILKYLPKSLLTHTLEKDTGLNEHLIINEFQRPLNKLNATGINQSLTKKSIISQISRFKKLGELRFTRVTKLEEQLSLLKKIIPLYDFHQGAANNALPFTEDHLKQLFHTKLCTELNNSVHLTGLWLNEQLVAAHLGFISKDTVHLGIFCHAPQFKSHSPDQLYLLWLAELLVNEGFTYLDLTPGENTWKERFANEHDTMVGLIYFSHLKDKQYYQTTEQTAGKLTQSLSRVGITPRHIRQALSLPEKLSSPKILKATIEKYFCNIELKIYQLTNKPDDTPKIEFKTSNLTDLIKFSPDYNWQNRYGFLAKCSQRLAAGEIPYTHTNSHKLLSYAWLIPNAHHVFFNEGKQGIAFPENSAILYDSYTTPTARRQGLHQASLQQRINDVFSQYNGKQLFIVVRSDNTSSRHVIEKYSFNYVGSLYYKQYFNKITKSQQLPDYLTLTSHE